MSRPVGERERILAAVTDVCLEQGVHGTSLRTMAAGADSNNRMLLYYFGSKEELLVAALAGAAARFPLLQSALSALRTPDRPIPERLGTAWSAISAPENDRFLRLFFEVVGMSASDPARFASFRADLITGWPDQVAAVLIAEGIDEATAVVLADQLVALWRGLQVQLISGAARDRVDAAHTDAVATLTRRMDATAVTSV